MKKKFYCLNHGPKTKIEQYVCKQCELLVCPKCDPNHNHDNAIRLVDSMFGKAEIESCFFCGEKDENKLAIENLGIAFGMSGRNYSFCVKCLKEKTAFEFIEKIAESEQRRLPLIYKGFDMSNHILLKNKNS